MRQTPLRPSPEIALDAPPPSRLRRRSAHALKPLAEQVVLITGATSGIGLATARRAAARGAAVFLVARNGKALETLAAEITARGGRAAFAVADVGDEAQLRAAAQAAEAVFGGFDTWISNAGVSIFGRIEDTPLEDQRRLFDTNYWGVVHGAKIAVEHLRTRPSGGAIITVGSILSDYPIPLQGPYCASKHAVKGFVNALRLELLKDGHAIRVTLIKPAAMDTPYKDHARSHMGGPGTNPQPVYATPLVAEAILHAAEHPTREITVGGGGRLQALAGTLAPALTEPVIAYLIPWLVQDKKGRHGGDHDALDRPGRGLRERAPYGFVRERSYYSLAQMNGGRTAAILAGGAFALWLGGKLRRKLHTAAIRREAKREVRAEYEEQD